MSKTKWRRDIALYGALAFTGAFAAYSQDFPRWVGVFMGITNMTLLGIKAKLSNGNPDNQKKSE